MVIGSNGKIAWSLTNSGGNWSDLIEVEVDPTNPNVYRTPEGKRSFERHRELINIKGQPAEPLEILSTIWGPIIDHDHKKRPRALRWVALDPDGVNLNIIRMTTVRSVDEALALASTCGVPHVNLVVGDAQGRIGWTIMGRIPAGPARATAGSRSEDATRRGLSRVTSLRTMHHASLTLPMGSSGRPMPGSSMDRCSTRLALETMTGAAGRG